MFSDLCMHKATVNVNGVCVLVYNAPCSHSKMYTALDLDYKTSSWINLFYFIEFFGLLLEFKANIVRNHICLNLLKELEHGIKCTPQKAHADTFFDVTLMNAKKAK